MHIGHVLGDRKKKISVDTNLPKMNYWAMPRWRSLYQSYERMAAARLSQEHFLVAFTPDELEVIQEMITQRYNDTWTGMLAVSEAAREVMGQILARRGWTAERVFDRFLTVYFIDVTNLLKEKDVMDIMFNWVNSLLNVIENEDAKAIRARSKTRSTKGRQRRDHQSEKEYWDEMTAFELDRLEQGPQFRHYDEYE